jgi:peroxiredoxin
MQPIVRRILFVVILAAGLAWIGLSAGGTQTVTAAPQEGFLAPNFTLQSITGETYTLSDLRGQAVVINLWATWCPPCRAEMPALQKMYEEYKDQGLIILAVNSTVQDTASAVAPFAAEHGLTFPILLDDTGLVTNAYQVRSLPSSYFIDRKGIVRQVIIGGPMAEALLRTRIEDILK